MKRLRWTSHARNAIVQRNIDVAIVEETIRNPELTALDPPWRAILMRRYFDVDLDQEMLMRVVVEESTYERVIITVYRTSQIARYLGR